MKSSIIHAPHFSSGTGGKKNDVSQDNSDVIAVDDSMEVDSEYEDPLDKTKHSWKESHIQTEIPEVISQTSELREDGNAIDKKHLEQYVKCEQLEKEYSAAKAIMRKREAEIAELKQQNVSITTEVENLRKQIEKQNQAIELARWKREKEFLHIKELESRTNDQEKDISELTQIISQTAYSINTVTRDDAYFDGEFASLAGDVRQWAFRYFRGGPEISHRVLPAELHQAMGATILDYHPIPDRKVSQRDIEASVTELIIDWAFAPAFVFSIVGDGRQPQVLKTLGGSDREQRELKAKMTNLVIRNPRFDTRLSAVVAKRATEIHHLYSSLIKEEQQEICQQSLISIIKKAALLKIETTRQVASFELPIITPGSKYQPSLMDDNSDTVDMEESGRHGCSFKVQAVLFPPVTRWGLDKAGTFVKNSVVIRKAAVIVKDLAQGP